MTSSPNPEPSAAQSPAPATLRERFARIRERADLWLYLPSLLMSLVSGALASYLYLNGRVDAVISTKLERRMMPYERYMTAQMQATNEDPDRCADALGQVLPLLDSDEFKGISRSPFYDLAISCARDAAYPAKYRGDVKRIEAALARGQAASSGWHQGALGLFYFRTGDLPAAKENLRNAVSMLNAEGWPSEEAFAHWSLALLYLAEGNGGAAAAEYRLAARLDPRAFEARPSQARFEADISQPRFRFLRDNPGFQKAVPGFLQALAGPPSKP